MGRASQARQAAAATTVRPKPAMLGILRGLAIRRIWPTLRPEDLGADAEEARVPLLGGRLAPVSPDELGGGPGRSGAVEQHHDAVAVFGDALEGGVDREAVAAAGVEEVEHRDGFVDADQGFDRRVDVAMAMARCTSPEVLSSKATGGRGRGGCPVLFADLLDQLLGARAVFDEVADGADLEAVVRRTR
jgi:hypothetical protein